MTAEHKSSHTGVDSSKSRCHFTLTVLVWLLAHQRVNDYPVKGIFTAC